MLYRLLFPLKGVKQAEKSLENKLKNKQTNNTN